MKRCFVKGEYFCYTSDWFKLISVMLIKVFYEEFLFISMPNRWYVSLSVFTQIETWIITPNRFIVFSYVYCMYVLVHKNRCITRWVFANGTSICGAFIWGCYKKGRGGFEWMLLLCRDLYFLMWQKKNLEYREFFLIIRIKMRFDAKSLSLEMIVSDFSIIKTKKHLQKFAN